MSQKFEVVCTLETWADYPGPITSVEETVNEDGLEGWAGLDVLHVIVEDEHTMDVIIWCNDEVRSIPCRGIPRTYPQAP